MALINKQEAIKEMIEGLRLDTARDTIPSQLADKVLPVFNINPSPRIFDLLDTLNNDSNKTFTVPSGKKWKLLYGLIQLTTTATAGNRRIALVLLESNSVPIYEIQALNVQVASTTERYSLGQVTDVSESVASRHLLPIPVNTVLIEDFQINILDNANVDATADDMTIHLIVEESNMNPNR